MKYFRRLSTKNFIGSNGKLANNFGTTPETTSIGMRRTQLFVS